MTFSLHSMHFDEKMGQNRTLTPKKRKSSPSHSRIEKADIQGQVQSNF